MELANTISLQTAADHLSRHDGALRPIIAQHGLAHLEPHTDYYGALVSSIVGQQLSVKAAAAIKQRFRDLFDGRWPTPQELLAVDAEQLRAIGFSYAKGRYVHDLAEHIIDGRITFDRIPQQTNQEIIAELTDVKGIGEWTVHMFLLFCVGRLDILPTGDLGIKNGVKALYGLPDVLSPQDIVNVAEQQQWHPYESVASWYIWRSLDNKPSL